MKSWHFILATIILLLLFAFNAYLYDQRLKNIESNIKLFIDEKETIKKDILLNRMEISDTKIRLYNYERLLQELYTDYYPKRFINKGGK